MSRKLMLPSYLKISEKPDFSNVIERTAIFEVKNTNGEQHSTLNNNAQELRFSYKGEAKYIRLGSMKTGFRITAGFRTRAGGNNNMNANITLANNWPLYLFRRAEFRLANQCIESVDNVGIASDIINYTRGTEWKDDGGSVTGFIPDTSQNADSNLVSTPTFNANNVADANAIVAVLNNKHLGMNPNYNDGYRKRKQLYNYTVAGNDVVRTVQAFVPLSYIFSFAEDYDKLLKFIDFDINIHRENEANYVRCAFGATDTDIQFGSVEGTGIISISLEIEQVFPRPDIAAELDKIYQKGPIDMAFLSRDCRNIPIRDSQIQDITETRFNIPKFAFLVFHGMNGESSQNTITSNFQLFRHCDIKNIQATLDGELYPNLQQNSRFKQNQFNKFYSDFLTISRKLGNDSALSATDYRDLYTIFALDLSSQKEKLTGSPTNLSFRVERNEVPADNTNANCGNGLFPRDIECYLLILNENHYSVDCVSKIVKKLN